MYMYIYAQIKKIILFIIVFIYNKIEDYFI